jgi:hypothetical protein
MMNKLFRLRFALLLYLVAATGCAEFDLSKRIPWGVGHDGTDEEPLKMAVFWTDAVMNQEGHDGTRGFGGRIMFYGRKESEPIKVEGTLTVYAFDESDGDTKKVTPDRKFVFTAEQFAKHYSKSSIGHSYSVWIPWDKTGGMQSDISLIARFSPKTGSPVSSEQSRNALPGVPRPRKANVVATAPAPLLQIPPLAPAPMPLAPGAMPGVQQISYQESIRGAPVTIDSRVGSDGPQRMTVTSIPITPQFGQGLPTAAVSPNRMDPRGQFSPGTQVGYQAPGLWNPNAPAAPMPQPLAVSAMAASPMTVSPAAAPEQPTGHFEPPRPRVLGAPIVQLEHDRGPWQQRPAEWPSVPPSSLQQGQATGTASSVPGSQTSTTTRY